MAHNGAVRPAPLHRQNAGWALTTHPARPAPRDRVGGRDRGRWPTLRYAACGSGVTNAAAVAIGSGRLRRASSRTTAPVNVEPVVPVSSTVQ